jgi:hypothetical protein
VSLEKHNFSYYRNEVFLPAVEQIRERYGGHIPGSEIPDELTASSWNDGGGPQLAAIVDEEQMAKEQLL